jgi:hypothetical protein
LDEHFEELEGNIEAETGSLVFSLNKEKTLLFYPSPTNSTGKPFGTFTLFLKQDPE